MSIRRSLPRVALTLLLAIMAAWAIFHREQINLATLDAWLASLGPWAPTGYVTLFSLATVVFVPGVVFSLAGGALFGPLWGSAWNLTGATLGATLAFLVARYVAGDWVARRAGGLLKRLIDGVDAEGWRFVAFVRLVPLFPFNLSNYVLGLTGIPLHQYVIATFICMVPGAVAYTWLGYAGRGALSFGERAWRFYFFSHAGVMNCSTKCNVYKANSGCMLSGARRVRPAIVSWSTTARRHPLPRPSMIILDASLPAWAWGNSRRNWAYKSARACWQGLNHYASNRARYRLDHGTITGRSWM